MKVLQINSVCGIGSTGRIATDIHKILIDQGHESYIAYGRGLPKNCDNTIKIGSRVDNYFHVLKTRVLDKHGFGSKKATLNFIKKVRKLEPDIIHLHNIHGYYINVEILFDFLKEFKKPVVWTLHDCWSFTGHCTYFDYAGCEKWITTCFNCPEKHSYPSSLLLDNSKKNYEIKKKVFNSLDNLIIVTPSSWLAKLVTKSFLGSMSVKVINNGIDLNTFKHSDMGFREKYRLTGIFVMLGVASVWDRRKGLKYFLELSEILADDELIVLVGLSKNQMENLPANVIGISRTNNINELVSIYSCADVFLNPTLEDNFPTTNLEALACGTPVITFDTGGSPESIDSKTGIVVHEKTTKELYNAIKVLKEKGRKFYSQECINRSRSLYNKDDRFFDYIKIYDNLLNNEMEK